MKRIITFFQESFAELKKVTWPNKKETVASTKVVLVSTIMIAVMLGLVDFVLFKIVDWLFLDARLHVKGVVCRAYLPRV